MPTHENPVHENESNGDASETPLVSNSNSTPDAGSFEESLGSFALPLDPHESNPNAEEVDQM